MNPSITERINAFLDHCDENGVSNSQKIYERQRIIRRVASTDKNKSYEEGASSNPSPATTKSADFVKKSALSFTFQTK